MTVDPYEWNEPAIRAWVKAGFAEVSRADGKVLMKFESDSAEPNQIRG